MYILFLFSLGKSNQYNKRKLPIPVKVISSHQPDLFISCSLLILTEMPGKNVKKKTNNETELTLFSLKKIASKRKDTKARRSSNNLQYQREKDFLSLFQRYQLSHIVEILHQEKLLVPYS